MVEALKIGTYKRVGCMMKKYSMILNYYSKSTAEADLVWEADYKPNSLFQN